MKLERLDTGIDLGGLWSFAFSAEPITPEPATVADLRRAGLEVYPASVPGNFELDLLAEGLIEEPFFAHEHRRPASVRSDLCLLRA